MPKWLMKSEPDELSIAELRKRGTARWDGVRNYQARNFVRSMQMGDQFFFYHSSCAKVGIAGIGAIISCTYPDPTALDPQSHYFDAKASTENNPWSAIDVEFVEMFPEVLPLSRLRAHSEALEGLALLQRASRLSVMPVSQSQWDYILGLR